MRMYYQLRGAGEKVAGHRILAINRGEKEKVLTVKVEAPEERYPALSGKEGDHPGQSPYYTGFERGHCGQLQPPHCPGHRAGDPQRSDGEGRGRSYHRCSAKNLKQLLMQPPIAGQVVLGWDPAFRTGCKLAVVDATGKVLDTAVIYPTAPQNKVEEAKEDPEKS